MPKVYVDIDLEVFETSDLLRELDGRGEEPECDCCLSDFDTSDLIEELSTRGFNTHDPEEGTIRDQQYDEIFDQLKARFTVSELEAFLNSK